MSIVDTIKFRIKREPAITGYLVTGLTGIVALVLGADIETAAGIIAAAGAVITGILRSRVLPVNADGSPVKPS